MARLAWRYGAAAIALAGNVAPIARFPSTRWPSRRTPPPGFRRSLLALAAAVAVAGLGGCVSWRPEIPAGAQVVHVTVRQESVSIDPTTFHAGPVYMLIDFIGHGDLVIVGDASSDYGKGDLRPLTSDQVDAYLAGEGRGFLTIAATTGTDFKGGRGKVGNLTPGSYLFVAGGSIQYHDDGARDPILRERVGVLDITP